MSFEDNQRAVCTAENEVALGLCLLHKRKILVSEVGQTEWLQLVIFDCVEPNSDQRHFGLLIRTGLLSSKLSSELELPKVHLKAEMYGHEPSLTSIFELP